MARNGQIVRSIRRVASAVSEEIDNDYPVLPGNESNHRRPEMGRREGSMDENDRVAGLPRARSIVVEPFTAQVDELAAHDGSVRGAGQHVGGSSAERRKLYRYA